MNIVKHLISGLIVTFLMQVSTVNAETISTSFVAIIIDDLGYNLHQGKRALDLPGAVTYSILPYTAYSHSLAIQAHQTGREVMLHLPMENVRDQDIGPDGLTSRLPKDDFVSMFYKALADVPFAQGINNHMGSFLTQQPEQMRWLMHEIRENQIYFVDSLTTPLSVAGTIAQQNKILESSRDIFLDNTRSFFAIDQSFRNLIKLSRINGSAIAICHPYKTTLAYLEIALPLLEDEGVHLVSASTLLALQSANLPVNSLASVESTTKPSSSTQGSE